MDINREEPDCVQKGDGDESIKLKMGEGIFQLFIEMSSKIENIILLRLKIIYNLTYTKAASFKSQLKDKRIIRNMGKKSEVQIPVKPQSQRSRKGSHKLKKLARKKRGK